MKRIQRLAIERPISTLMFYLGVVMLGLVAFKKLEVNLMPDLEFPRLTIATLYANAAPLEVENLISKPISDAVSTVGGIQKISSESLEGVSFVTLQFSWDTQIDFAAMEVREKVDLVRSILPQDASKSMVSKFDPNQEPIAEIIFTPKKFPKPKNLRFFLKTEVKNYLDRIAGVALVQFAGGHQREIKVEVDPSLMTAYRLSLGEIKEAIQATNVNFPAGFITRGNKDLLIRTIGEYKDLKDIGQTIVGRDKFGIPVKLSSVAEISDSYKERTGLARWNGKECVIAQIYKEAGKNTVEVARNIKKELKSLKNKFHNEIDIQLVYDQSRFISQAVRNILQALILGGLLAFFFLVLFLRNFTSPLILLSAVPISIIATFLLMYWRGLSLNLMTLGGLSFGIGMLFDSGNVVLAAIERHLHDGLAPKEASLQGVREVTGSVSTAIITTIIVFLPLVFLRGILGAVFSEMALTICFSLIVSLVVSLTLLPMLSAARNMRKDNAHTFASLSWVKKIADREEHFKQKYASILLFCLQRPKFILALTLTLFLLSLYLLPRVEQEFIAKVDSAEFNLRITSPRGTNLDLTLESVKYAEKILLESGSVRGIVAILGYDEEQIFTRKGSDMGTHVALVRVMLEPAKNIKTLDFIKKFRTRLRLRPDIEVDFDSGGDIIAKILSPDARAITLDISGDDTDILKEIGVRLSGVLGNIKGVTDIKSSLEQKGREYHLMFRPERLAAFGLSHEYLAAFLKNALKGDIVSHLRVHDEEIAIRLNFKEQERKNLDKIQNYILKTPKEQFIFLSEVAHIQEDSGYTSILRVGQNRINRISANIDSPQQRAILEKLAAYIQRIKLPLNYRIYFGGERENIENSFHELAYAVILAVVLIYLVLASQFQSLKFPLILLCAVPLLLIGVIPSLLLANKSLNIYTFIGIILLIGTVVDSSVLFSEYLDLLQKKGLALGDSVLASGKIIIKPLIMNQGTTFLGLLPIALELGEGTELQSPMAITVMGGIFVSALLSLFLIPTLIYHLRKGSGHGNL